VYIQHGTSGEIYVAEDDGTEISAIGGPYHPRLDLRGVPIEDFELDTEDVEWANQQRGWAWKSYAQIFYAEVS
jgi:hypothetical protein